VKRILAFLLTMVWFVSAAPAFAQTLADPVVPDGEELVYRQTVGSEVSQVTVKTSRKTWNGRDVYEITGSGRSEDQILRVGRPGLDQLYSFSREKHSQTTVERQTSIVRNEIKTSEGEIVLIDFLALEFLLRGYPLDGRKTVAVRTVQESGFGFQVNRLDDAVLPVAGKNVSCYRLELALTGFLGAIFPKTVYWYSLDSPHFLVRFEGSSGAPGSPKKILELMEFPHAEP
jgi:hypothetical protein